jgi:alkylated DNA repair dioxygenase AlkB
VSKVLFQESLFEEKIENPIEQISGLIYIPDFITNEQESELIRAIDKQPWICDLKRRVQHYGYKYDYKARNVTHDLKLGDLPLWIKPYCQKLVDEKLFRKPPDQVIVNEYQIGQGISSHLDCVPCFEETIASISLNSPCTIDFTNSTTNKKIPIFLEPCSLFVLKADARYKWKHGIAGRKSDKINGNIITRRRRISITFRNVILA